MTARGDDALPIDHDLLGSRGNRHQAGGALAMERLARHRHRQACGQQTGAGKIQARGTSQSTEPSTKSSISPASILAR